MKIFIRLSCVVLVVGIYLIASSQQRESLREKFTRNSMDKIVQKDENPFSSDVQAKGVQVFRVNDYSVFMNEAARAHARLEMDVSENVKAESYKYLIPFYARMIRDDFRETCEQSFPAVGKIERNQGLQISVDMAKEAVQEIDSLDHRMKIFVEWYKALGRIRAESTLGRGFLDVVGNERTAFLEKLDAFVDELINHATQEKAAFYAEHLRVMGGNFKIWPIIKIRSRESMDAFNVRANEALLRYASGIANRDDISYKEKMHVFVQAALALIELRHIRGLGKNSATETTFTAFVDDVWNAERAKNLTDVQRLRVDLEYTLVRDKLAPEFWTGTEIVEVSEQSEPKPYKIAIEIFRSFAEEVEDLLLHENLSQSVRLEAELIALEASTWISQLIQDNGIVKSSDFDFDFAKLEQEKLLKARLRVKNNPLQTSQEAITAIHRARVIELDFYKYHESEFGFQKIIELTNQYIPEIFSPLSGPFSDPEGRPDIRCGAIMLLWRGAALANLNRYDEAIEYLNYVKLGMSDRYDDPLVSGIKVRKQALRYLRLITDKRNQRDEIQGGAN